MNKGRDTAMKVFAILALVYIITRTDLLKFIGLGKSGYELKALEDAEQEPANNNVIPRCEMKAGTGLASSLLPREVASQEDFGQFAPEDVLQGQNFMDPRQQPISPRRASEPKECLHLEQQHNCPRLDAA